MYSICRAEATDAESILELQKAAYQSEAERYNDWSIAPMTQTLAALQTEFADYCTLKALSGKRIIGSIRATLENNACHIGRLMVHPDFQRCGVGKMLLQHIEPFFPQAHVYRLFTGHLSENNIRLYQKQGYLITHTEQVSPSVTLIYLEKRRQI